MLAVRDLLLKKSGFEWPYLFVTCLPFNNDVDTTTQILSSSAPAMIGFERFDINDSVLELIERAQDEAGIINAGSSRVSIPSRSEETFIVDVDIGRILSLDDYKRGSNRAYSGAVLFDIPTFFEQISQSALFNGPSEVLNLA